MEHSSDIRHRAVEKKYGEFPSKLGRVAYSLQSKLGENDCSENVSRRVEDREMLRLQREADPGASMARTSCDLDDERKVDERRGRTAPKSKRFDLPFFSGEIRFELPWFDDLPLIEEGGHASVLPAQHVLTLRAD